MSDNFDDIIQEVAVKHGVVLSKEDPILILHTMNERMLAENRQAQALMLTQFREEMEIISSQWKDDARTKAEKIINAALSSTKEATAKLLQETLTESIQAIQKMTSSSVAKTHELTQQARNFNWFTLLTSCTIFMASCLFVLLYK